MGGEDEDDGVSFEVHPNPFVNVKESETPKVTIYRPVSILPDALKESLKIDRQHILTRYKRFVYERTVYNKKEPYHHNFISYEKRLRTFDDWPKQSPAKPKALAGAGFFYHGYADGILDCTVCFYCNQGVCLWERGDAPVQEHKRLNPSCPFIMSLMTE